MIFFYTIPLILLILIYVAALYKLRQGFANLKPGQNKTQPKVSIVIAARNEEKNIVRCLDAILNQTYPQDKLQVVVVDDRSEDRTFDVVKKIAQSERQLEILQIRESTTTLAPKKRALDLGIRKASGEIIVTTDADCEPGPEWIVGVIKHFEPDIGLVAGFNPYQTHDRSLFQQMLALDYFAMASVAAASAGLNYPLSCSGGNLAYRKEVYLQLGGFENFGNWVSGDDDFFLEKVRDKTTWKIVYSTDSKTFVPTAPPQNLMEFVHQRIRYASKSRHYTPAVTFSLTGVYLINLLIALGLVISVFKPQLLPICLTGWGIKIFAESIFLRTGQKVFTSSFKTTIFFLTEIFHPFYIVLVGLLGQACNFRWKGEEYSAKVVQQKTLTVDPT